MALLQPSTLRRGQAGNLNIGIVERSIGYLQGGYYTGTLPGTRNDGSQYPPAGQERSTDGYLAWQAIQLFNTITQVGEIVANTGYPRRYYAGISGNTNGYYSYDTDTSYQRLNYINVTSSVAFATLGYEPGLTFNDAGVLTQAWILSYNGTGQSVFGTVAKYFKLALDTETITDKGSLSTSVETTSRQGLDNAFAAFPVGGAHSDMYSLSYATETVSFQTNFIAMTQIYCGMSVTNTYGFLIGYNTVRFGFSGTTVISAVSVTPYTYNFGESHSLTNSTYGYMMAGYNDTTGRYSSVQHALCQRVTLASGTITTLNDVLLPQSSGHMMQGF